MVKSSPVFRWLCGASVVHRRTSRWPRSTKPAASSRACQPSLVPIVAVSSSRPCFSSCWRQPGELGVEGMIGRQKRLLAMQDRRVCAGGVIEAIDLAGAERELDAALERRVRVGLEIGINEVRNLA